MNTICPISKYTIKTDDRWIVSSKGYKIEISIIGENILHTKNYGYATLESISKSWPIIEEIIEKEIKTDKYFIVHDYSEYKGANAKVRINFVKWIKEHDNNILGIFIYSTTPFTRILLNTGKLLLNSFEKSYILKNYEETILQILEINSSNNNSNISDNKFELRIGASFNSGNNTYVIKKTWQNDYENAKSTTFLINDNIFIRKFEGLLGDNIFEELERSFNSILEE